MVQLSRNRNILKQKTQDFARVYKNYNLVGFGASPYTSLGSNTFSDSS